MVEIILSNMGLLLVIAILTEAATEVLKQLFPDYIQDRVTYFVSIFVGIALAYALNANVFMLGGWAMHVSLIFAGLIASRGANFIHGVAKRLEIIKSFK